MRYQKTSVSITLENERGLDGQPVVGEVLTVSNPTGSLSVTLFVESPSQSSWRMATVVSVTSDGRTGRPLPSWVDKEADTVDLPSFDTPFMETLFEAARGFGARYLRVLDYTDAFALDDAHFETQRPYPEHHQLSRMISGLGGWKPKADLRQQVKAAPEKRA